MILKRFNPLFISISAERLQPVVEKYNRPAAFK